MQTPKWERPIKTSNKQLPEHSDVLNQTERGLLAAPPFSHQRLKAEDDK